MLEGVSTRKEKEYVLDKYVAGLERQGWFLRGSIEAIWAGERDVAKLKAASEMWTPALERVIGTILAQAPTPTKAYARSKGTSLRRSVHGVGVSAESTAALTEFSAGERVRRTPLEVKQMERSTAKNPFFKDLDAEQKVRLFDGMEVEEFGAGDTIIQQGDVKADKFYVIKSGRSVAPLHSFPAGRDLLLKPRPWLKGPRCSSNPRGRRRPKSPRTPLVTPSASLP